MIDDVVDVDNLDSPYIQLAISALESKDCGNFVCNEHLATHCLFSQ